MPKTYKVAELSPSPDPDPENMEHYKRAAETLHRILNINGIEHAFLGGLPLYLLGNTRTPGDIDVVVNAKLKDVRGALKTEEEIVLPDSKQVEGVLRIKIPIQVGGREISVRADIFDTSRALGHGVSLGSIQNVDCETQKIPVLKYTQLVNTKLKAWCQRYEEKDAKDVYFLVHKAGSHIHKERLIKKFVDEFCTECPDGLTKDQFREVKKALK